MTTELFLFLCKKVDLDKNDMEDMTIGMCIDYMEEVVSNNSPDKKKCRKATQADFDSF
ncbi:MAG: hypothetical protein E6377_17960 [Clostridium sp.]|uniref:hypothetical protein n=1 Tax=Clostridium sp. TaxID=1506 RepID=UPI00257E13FC|nr:hypothetical protein [Clostridium sp.]MBS6888631.1 hypothetical protein [Clostridium sp.]MDU6876347.1 hypothetical protein [Clostridium sp.]MDU6937365.1 hypothetical protein [Clostridium sp.]